MSHFLRLEVPETPAIVVAITDWGAFYILAGSGFSITGILSSLVKL
jgi:hypothetical protein